MNLLIKHFRVLTYALAFFVVGAAFVLISKPHQAKAASDFNMVCYNQSGSSTYMMAGQSANVVINLYNTSWGAYTDGTLTASAGSFSPSSAVPPTTSYNNNPSTQGRFIIAYINSTTSTTPGTYSVTYTVSNASYSHSCSFSVNILAYNPSVYGSTTCNGSSGDCTVDWGDTANVTWTSSGTSGCFLLGDLANYGTSGSATTGALYIDTMIFFNLYCSSTDGTYYGIIKTFMVKITPELTITCDGVESDCSALSGTSHTIAWSTLWTTECTVSPGGGSGRTGSLNTGALTVTTTYTLSCTAFGGNTSTTRTVNITVAPTATGDITCNGITNTTLAVVDGVPYKQCDVPYGQSVTLDWTSSNATTCNLDGYGGWYRSGLSGSATITATTYTTYTLDCTWPTSEYGMVASMIINPSPQPTGTITCNGSSLGCSIATGASATIAWSSSNTTTCTVSPSSWTGTSGSQSTGALVSTQTYTLGCTQTVNGQTAAMSPSPSVTVTVGSPLPTGTISCTYGGSTSADSCTIPYNSSSTISWVSTNATSCSVSPGSWTGTSGSQSSGSLTASTTYTLSCSGAGGEISDQVTVNVQGDFTINCTPATQEVVLGDAVTFNLSATRLNGFTGAIDYSGPEFSPGAKDGAPNPPIADWDIQTETYLGATPNSTLYTDSDTSTAEPYTLTYSATSGSLTHTCTAYLYVVASLPTEPTSVTADNTVTCETITVEWEGSTTGIEGYRVYRRTSGTGTSTDSWSQVGSDIPISAETSDLGWGFADIRGEVPVSDTYSGTFSDDSPLSLSGSNYYAVVSYSASGLESAMVESSNNPIVPRMCSADLSLSDIDLLSVTGKINQNFTTTACSGTSEVATLPNNVLFSNGDTLTFRLSVCNSGALALDTTTAVINLTNMTDLTIVEYNEADCGGQSTGVEATSNSISLTINALDAPTGAQIATSCSVTFTAVVDAPADDTTTYARFQARAALTSDSLSANIYTPPYLFGAYSGTPDRSEVPGR